MFLATHFKDASYISLLGHDTNNLSPDAKIDHEIPIETVPQEIDIRIRPQEQDLSNSVIVPDDPITSSPLPFPGPDDLILTGVRQCQYSVDGQR